MADQQTTVVIADLNMADAQDLVSSLGEYGGGELVEPHVDEDAYGIIDPVTGVVIVLGSIALKGVIAWMLKRNENETIEFESEVIEPDGRIERRKVKLSRSIAETDEGVASAMQQLTAAAPA